MEINRSLLREFYEELDGRTRKSLDEAVEKMVGTKRRGGRIVVVTGSGPNLHEGVTTLIADLMDKGLVDGVTTSSAVVAHEMGGCLDRVKMCPAGQFDLDPEVMPRGNHFEFTCLTQEQREQLRREMLLDEALLDAGERAEGHFVIKAAGNMAYPVGLRTEKLGSEISVIARQLGLPFEVVAGWGCDRRTLLGIGAEKGIPVLVTIPQLVGGGHVGLGIGDSIPVSQRSARLAKMLSDADIIIESAVALTQEIHDGPFETYTGHGIWSWWQGLPVYSLAKKTLIRIDLDENLRKAYDLQRDSAIVQEAIAKGLPKTKISNIPFRMEMSAFARLEGSLPLIGDIGTVWPVLAWRLAAELGIELEFMSYKQETEEGKTMREWIVNHIKMLDRDTMMSRVAQWRESPW